MKTYLIAFLLVVSLIVDGAMAGADPSLVLYLPFDAGNGDRAEDLSGHDNHGELIGGPKWVDGRSGMALEFSGAENTNHVEVADAPSLNPREEVTVMAWIFFDVWAPTGGVVSKYTGAGNQRSYDLYMDHDRSLSFRSSVSSNGAYQVGTSTTNAVAPAETLVEGQWQHVSMTYKGGEFLRLYHDGNMVAESEATATESLFDNTTPLMVGTDFAVGSAHNGQPREFTGVIDEVIVFGRQLSADEIQKVMGGLADPALAAVENPDDGETDVGLDVVLDWTPGEFAQTHNVYLGTSFGDVSGASLSDPRGVLVAEGLTESSFDPGRLAFDQTYYWRVDEVNGAPDLTILKGNVWSFTTEPLAYPVQNVLASSNGSSDAGAGPENIVNGSGLNEDDEHSVESADMWLAAAGDDPLRLEFEFDRIYKLHEMMVWNYNVQFEPVLGFGVKGVTVEYSSDGVDWAILGEAELAQATATANYTANTTVEFGGVGATFVRLAVNSGYGPTDQFGLSEVRFTFIPVQAREPQPADGAAAVGVDAGLAWRVGREAAVHDVYLDTVADTPALADTVATSSYTLANLQFGTTYYWRIDEVNEAEAVSVWPGDLWSFSTFEYAVIDDMERYDDEENRIFDVWLDGFVNETGSTVGYFEAPFSERTIVNSGGQSMPFEYVNDTAPFYSEAELDLGSVNLDTHGADTLRLFIAGQADNAPEPVYVALQDASGKMVVVTCPDGGIAAVADWTEWTVPYSDLVGIDLGRVSTMYIGVGNRDNPTAGGAGLIFLDDIGYGKPAPVE
jgi:concanavalin A-like lectin/glucanase superfamily protein